MPPQPRIKILVVEDDESFQDFYKEFFKTFHKNEFVWHLAPSGEAALEYLARNEVDLIVLDWTLPGISGLETLSRVRKKDRFVLTILVTAHAKPEDVCAGLDKGADDYLTKPYDPEVLLSHLHCLKRRAAISAEPQNVHDLAGLRVDLNNGFLTLGQKRVELSGKERDLLSVFLRRPNMTHSPAYLMECVWGYELADRNVLERRISSLRKKLGPEWGAFLKSKYGSGYSFEADLSSTVLR